MKSSSFSKAILVGIAVSLPVILGIIFDHLGIGLALCFGAFWSSPSNTHGSFHHKKSGILFSTALVTVVSFIGGYLNIATWLLIPVLGLLTFAIAYISIYGFRASLISFSGLLALVLSFAHTPSELAPYEYSLFIGAGGLWYLLLVSIAYRFNRKAQTEESLSETFELTAKFLDTRASLIGEQTNREELQRKLHELQTDLIEHHETLRDILISSRKASGNSNYENKKLLIFIQLVEMLETAIANPVDYDTMDTVFVAHPTLKQYYQDIIFTISNQLHNFANSEETNSIDDSKIDALLKSAGENIQKLNNQENYEHFIILQNLLEYQEKQFVKLKRIRWLSSNPQLETSDFLATNALKRFLIPRDYNLKMGLRNFTFKSVIFRHSLRLAVTIMLGYLIGVLLEFQNPYWILLTIIVIMRPSYGLTKARSKDRIIGTLLGAVIAAGMVLFIKDFYVLGALGIVSLVVAFSVVQKNYKASATFVTLSVVFIYAILRPDILVVIQYRIIDTIIGAALSFMAILWLWPAWGFLEIRGNIKASISANRNFLKCISEVYVKKTAVSTEYKIARKVAFLETSNLNAAFQRMAQEPKSKQKNIDAIYELVVLNHTMLSSLASLSTYLQHHKTTPASEHFKKAVKIIDTNLAQNISVVENPSEANKTIKQSKILASTNERLANFSFKDVESMIKTTSNNERNFQEAHLIWEQLRWLHSISEKMLPLTEGLELD
ncbi:FUSC family protein [Ulvibacter antarcticus]|uniref:Putative membrane protein YccC n=1 Tax=Ulvibacter antarcticus TaxID=442714 RepID=A0A3L9YEF2_9FLAO|nr:FUSC family membrane protein [Ulvibacter antarcticus]RMA58754.1 putative membrane protein YccC [Ulvibacter antarcticus]